MRPWKLSVRRGVLKDLRDLPKDVRGRAALTILELASGPTPEGAIRLQGQDHAYRIRVGDYRILYEITEDEVVIVAVKHRKEAYRGLS